MIRPSQGTAAVEFALIAPAVVMMLLGTVEATNAFRAQAKATTAAGQLANMIAGQPAVTEGSQANATGSLVDICQGAAFNMLPYNTTSLAANIASITNQTVNGSVVSTLNWESDNACPAAATHVGAGAMMALANSANSTSTLNSVIVVQATYTYENVALYFIPGLVSFQTIAIASPRGNATIPCTTTPIGSTSPTACPQNP